MQSKTENRNGDHTDNRCDGRHGKPDSEGAAEEGPQGPSLGPPRGRSLKALTDLGAEVVYGDITSLRDVRRALEGVNRAYFCYPVADGLVEAAVIFAQAAREQKIELIVNMSHKQSRPHARSKVTQNHWLSEQVFDWSGIPTTHLRVTFFAEWLLYISPLIQRGRYVMPFGKDGRFARWQRRTPQRSSPTSWKSRMDMAAKPINSTARRNSAMRNWRQR